MALVGASHRPVSPVARGASADADQVGGRPRRQDGAAFVSDEDRWTAVLRRDPRADGRFLYSVRTTGGYCRPSCASRRARRENVRFHRTPSEAEAAGFRPCRRCRPTGASLVQQRAAAVAKACRLIETAETPPDL